MNKQQGFIGVTLAVIVALIVIGGGVYYYNQSKVGEDLANKEDNSNWKTYRNKEYGFEFEYPSSWNIENVSNRSLSLKSPDYADKRVDNEEFGYIETISGSEVYVGIHENPDSKNLKELENLYKWLPFHIRYSNEKMIMIDGKEALIFDVSYNDDSRSKIGVAYLVSNKLVNIEYSSADINDELFNKFLSTFKFTN